MSIQQSINQALGLSALLASQSPMAAAHKEKVLNQAAIKEEEKALNTQREALEEAGIDVSDMNEREVKLDGEKVELDKTIPEDASTLIVSKRIKGAVA